MDKKIGTPKNKIELTKYKKKKTCVRSVSKKGKRKWGSKNKKLQGNRQLERVKGKFNNVCCITIQVYNLYEINRRKEIESPLCRQQQKISLFWKWERYAKNFFFIFFI